MTDTNIETPAVAETAATSKPETAATETTTLLGGVVTEQSAEGETAAESDAVEGEGTDETPAGAPEKYEFNMPEGYELAAENAEAFELFARSNNLTNEAANQALDMAVKHVAKIQDEAVQQWRDEVAAWGNTIKTDKELGGDKLNASIAIAQKTVARFGSPELVTYLEQSGIGNHPEVFKFCHRIGLQISEGGLVTGAGSGEGRRSTADVLYGNSAA